MTTAAKSNLFTREDTIFGVCEALGEDFGFNPLWLRITLAVMVLVNAKAVIAVYFGLGLVVLASRLLFPNTRRVAKPAAETEARTLQGDNDQVELAAAA